MQGSTSKLRNVFGEASKEKYEDVRPSDTTTEGSLIDVNSHFAAVRIRIRILFLKFIPLFFRFLGTAVEEVVSQFSILKIFLDFVMTCHCSEVTQLPLQTLNFLPLD